MSAGTGANLGFEDKLWSAADKLRGAWMGPNTGMSSLG